MNANAGDAERRASRHPFLPIAFGVSVEREGASNGPACGVGLIGMLSLGLVFMSKSVVQSQY